MHGEGHLCTSATPSGQTEQHRGRRIQGYEDRHDWKLCPQVFRSINTTFGPLEVDLFASRLTTQLPTFVSWRPDPEAMATDAFTLTWTNMKAYANPPWSSVHGSSAVPGSPTEGEPSSNSPDLEDPVLVSKNPINVHRLPTNHSGETQPDPGKSYPGNATRTCNSPSSRVDYLRRRYQEQQLLEEATELMLSSWREKSSRSYDSQFQKWITWCRMRSINPISCPVGEVVNCLADLSTQGYQYRSLNAFRSTISSVHNKVNGCDVGQNPLVTRLLKGASKTTSATVHSDVGRGIGHRLHIKSKGENKSIPFQDKTIKVS